MSKRLALRILIASLLIVLLLVSCATQAPKACPACGSSSWRKIMEKDTGYNFGKGVVGRAFLGPIGWLAGSMGNSEDIYYCIDCGFSCSY